eukprot:TRINITY_DN1352_c0_g1_i1.p1 TRINITY_DN1352_c0_g1~~TRINITY_DN1352_c0_g1_i1.p1  ORF type:complete len:783 (+),score=171.53 TRINITY_DN1352_c0_g1_i1:51-2351(+)
MLSMMLLSAVASADPQTDAVKGLIGRTIPERFVDSFELSLLPSSACGDGYSKCFKYDGKDGKVQLSGTTGVELSMAFYHYLKYTGNSVVSWPRTGGNQISFTNASSIPMPAAAVSQDREHEYSYYANVCTFSYSFVWYQESDWVREIDWMAMHGINLPLAYTGQEKVYQMVYNKLGVTDEQLGEFFGGPAFLAWARGQGLMEWGGPLPQSWIDGQFELQKKILSSMRAFGMKPVLPAFQGNVPVAMIDLYPKANISRVGKCENPTRSKYACAPWMDALDPLFNTTADLFMTTLIKEFGTDHVYAADGTFSPVAAPWYSEDNNQELVVSDDGGDIDQNAYAHSKAAYAGMTRTDPDAIWIYQTWSWLYGQKEPYMRGWISAVPTGKLILLDLMAEESPLYKKTQSYFGAPFIWCMLHDFGGNDGMWGDMKSVANGPVDAKNSGSTIVGTGLTMEGINQNALIYEMMNEMGYRTKNFSTSEWVSKYAVRRYGAHSTDAAAAWSVIGDTAYSCPGYSNMVSKDTITAIPSGTGWDKLSGSHWYNETVFCEAWGKLISASKDFTPTPETFKHDLADVTRQALAKYSTAVYNDLAAAINSGDVDKITAAGAKLIELGHDMDKVLSSVESFLFGTWLSASAKWGGGDAATSKLMVWNAKTQVTFWNYPQPSPSNETGPVNQIPGLMDYANKQWGGLMSTYYAGRWQFYINYIVEGIKAKKTFDVTQFHVALIDWYDKEWRGNESLVFPDHPIGDTVAIAKELYAKYAPLIMS